MSIGRKFTICVVSTLLLAMAASVLTFSSFQLKEEEKNLEIFSRMTGGFIRESLVSSMLERKRARLREKLSDIKKGADSIGNIWLLNRDGVVQSSTAVESEGTKLKTEAQGEGKSPWNNSFLQEKKTYRLVQSVPNDPPCRRCHGQEAKYNGTIVIDFFVGGILDHVQKEIYRAAAIMLIVLLATGAAILVLWNVLVAKRLNSVVDKVRLVKEGSYRSDQEPKGEDEFARLEQDFNQMAEAIQARDIEKGNLVRQLSLTNKNLVQEIGMRKQGEVMLREQKMFSDNLLQNSAVATFVLDKDHRVLTWNKACEKLTGVHASDMIGTNSHWKAFYGSPRQTLADLVLDRRADLSGLYEKHAPSALSADGLHAEGWYRELNGRDRYIIFDAAPIRDSDGELIAAIETLQEVTAQKNMEEALARSEVQLRTIIETEPECVKLVSPEGTILEINRAGLAMIEAESPDDVVGKSMMPLIVPEYHPAVLRHMSTVLKGAPDTIEFEMIGLKGNRRWVETCAAPLRNGRGDIFGMVAVTRDVTERKQWEKKLQEQLDFLNILMDTIPMPVFYKDMRGVYQGCNKAFERFMSLSKDKVIGKTVYDIMSRELADLYHERDRELFDNPGSIQINEYPMQRSDGSAREVISSKATYRDANGDTAGLIGVLQDITERKRAEEAVRQTNEALQTLVNASPIPILVLDLDGNVMLWNPAAERVFGWTAQEAVGNFNPILAEQKREEFVQFQERIMRGEAFTAIDVQRRTKDGRSVDISLSTAPLRDGHGEIIGSMALLTDITARKQAESLIRRNYDTQTVINWILHISLGNMPIEKILKQTLDLILSIPWLSFESRGSIFLVEDEPDKLIMKAQRGLSEQIRRECAVVPFGRCHCGRAAARGDVHFSDSLDDRHAVTYDGISPHGHYCIPIKHSHAVIGVINIYLKEGHVRDDKEIEFLNAIANALAGIIKRSRAETALLESEKRYRTLAEAAHDVIFIITREGRIQYVNSFGAKLFQRTPQEQIGKNIADFFPPDISKRQRKNISAVAETGESLYVENVFSFFGAESWLGTWLVPLKDEDGSISAVLGVSRDITDRKRSEQEREKLIQDLQKAFSTIFHSHKEWQDTFDSITDMIAIIDKEFNIVKANTAFAAYFGKHPREVINKKCYEFHHESGAPIPGCPHQKTLAEKNAFSEEVLDKRTKKIFRVTTFPYAAPGGEIIGSIHVSRDITDEKEREARLIISERLAALGQMASGIAHEINNPLASIAGCSEGLLARVKKGKCDYKLFETYLNIIQEEIFRCKSITTAMLSFVRKTTYEKKDVDINALLDRTLEIISFQGRLKNVKIEKKYSERSSRVQANEGELRQVFLAVFTNALDAMKDEGTLILETGTNGNGVRARITDSGAGISPEDMAKIFDPFFTTKSETGGTGLGLSIARKIIHNHNGGIEAASEPGKGSTFTITLPAS